MKQDPTHIPAIRILRLITKALRFSKNGYTREERRELGLDLLLVAAHVLENIELDGRQEALFDGVLTGTGE